MRTDDSSPLSASAEIYDSFARLVTLLARDDSTGRRLDAVPPVELETRLNGGPNTAIGRYYGELLTQTRELAPGARILDMGCGYGRIALDLASRLTDDQHYLGLDPHLEAIEWARDNIASHRPNFTFEHIDITSRPYNPEGTVEGTTYRFPCDDNSLDLVFMFSVLTHVDLDTVQSYIREAARTLKPDTGRLVATFFLLDWQVNMLLARGRGHFRMRWRHRKSRVENRTNPELAIAHPRKRILAMLSEAGFAQTTVRNGAWPGRTGIDSMDFQDLLIADLGSGSTDARVAEPPVEIAELRDLVDHVAKLEMTEADLEGFLPWAAAVTLNALWWQSSGLTLSLTGVPADRDALDLSGCRALGSDTSIPAIAATGQFTPVDESTIFSLVNESGARATQQGIVRLITEIVRTGLVINDALDAAAIPELRTTAGELLPVPIQPWR